MRDGRTDGDVTPGDHPDDDRTLVGRTDGAADFPALPRQINREISWLSFNYRVLQEAMDEHVPLFERLGFLAIYSSNLDEFFRVRVAGLRSLLRLKKKSIKKLGFNPSRTLRRIHTIVTGQQELFGETLRRSILPGLETQGIFLIRENEVPEVSASYLLDYFRRELAPLLEPVELSRSGDETDPFFLEDRHIYLVVELWPGGGSREIVEAPDYALVEIPSGVDRFVVLPAVDERRLVMFGDDVIRFGLDELFPDRSVGQCYSVKLSRDAHLHLEDEYEGSLVEKVRKSLAKRDTGVPSRFLYDTQSPFGMISGLAKRFNLADEDLVPGGRYHNLHDLRSFPRFDLDDLAYEPLPPVPHPGLDDADSLLESVGRQDRVLHFPYQSYEYVVRFLEEASADAAVEEISITLYRVSDDSAVVKALLRAAQRGVRVTACVEVQARFDEASNLFWADRMEQAGVRILYGLPGLKVHAKLPLVARRESGARRLYGYLGTGNFNEKTARFYADYGLLTADPRLTEELDRLFQHLSGAPGGPEFSHLFVAPWGLRAGLEGLMNREVAYAREGAGASMTLKMNSLEDPGMVDRLGAVASAGVEVRLVVRGICCLVPEDVDRGETIEATSIVDRFLEHGRAFVFGRGDREVMYLSSADLMKRNLDRRIEVAFPILDADVRKELRAVLDIQIADNTKARIIDGAGTNVYVTSAGAKPMRAQMDTYRFVEGLATAPPGTGDSSHGEA